MYNIYFKLLYNFIWKTPVHYVTDDNDASEWYLGNSSKKFFLSISIVQKTLMKTFIFFFFLILFDC